jgi:endonuclease/exonuclease/phosphatase family metal-dependent hydrolase
LGLDPKERVLQVQTLLGTDWLSRPDISPHVALCGDLNARPGSAPYEHLCTRLKDPQRDLPRRLATFPALFPVIRIDHVLTSPQLHVKRVSVPSDIIARLASDHRPLVIDLSPQQSPDA